MLFDDPLGWSFCAVGTWPRFAFMAVMVAALQFALVFVAITGGWFPAMGLAVLLAGFQLMFLFALRRLLPIRPRGSTDANSVG